MTRAPRRLKAQVQETVSELPIHAARLAVMGVGQALLLTDRVRKDYREARESGLRPVLGRLRDDAGHLTVTIVGKVAGRVTGEAAPPKTAGGRKRRAGGREIAVGKPGRRPTGRTGPSAGPAKPSAGRPRPTASKAKAGPSGRAAAPSATAPAAEDRRPAAAQPETGAATASRAATAAAKAVPAKAEQARPTKQVAKPRTAGTKPSTAKPSTAEPPATKPSTAMPAGTATTQAKATAAPSGAGALPVPGYDQASLASVRARLRRLNARQVTQLRDYERAHGARAEFLRMYENRITKMREQG